MKPELILRADILDIIFENRNKEYGAYRLRKDYNMRMKKSLLAAGGLVLIAFVVGLLNFPQAQESLFKIEPPELVLRPFQSIPPPPPVLPKVKQATINFQTPIIVDEQKVEPIAEIIELEKEVAMGAETIDGPPASTVQLAEQGEGLAANEPKPVEIPKDDYMIHEFSEHKPEFPGGQAAFIRFLSKNLRVPEDSMEPGQKVKIVIRFVVGKEGELSNFQFIQSSGEVFEQEVVRVLKKMPKWKPGMQNGERVRVYFHLPVVFDVPVE